MNKKYNMKYCILPILCVSFLIFGLSDVLAEVTPGGASFKNPLEIGTVDALLARILTAVQSIVGILAVFMIVVGGILYITSAGDQGRVQLAKTAVTAAIIGFALAVAAPTFLQEIYTVLGGTLPGGTPVANKTLTQVITSALEFLLSIIGVLSILMLVVGGVMYMTSAGDQGRAETAKNTIKFAIVGLIVAILSLVIIKTIVQLF
jgi:hypothetical protein